MKGKKFDRTAATPAGLSQEFARAISNGELDVAAALFATDACLRRIDGKTLDGHQAIRDLLAQLIANRVSMDVEVGTVLEMPRAALASERWTMRFPGADGEGVEQSGKSTVVFGRGPKGWEIVIDSPWGL